MGEKKKEQVLGKQKKKKGKVFRKQTKSKADLNLSDSTSTTMRPIAQCTSCPANYTSFIIESQSKCFKYGTVGPLSSAVSTCAKDGARPPLPINAKQNADLLAYFLSNKEEHKFLALDLNDVRTEGEFISSTGEKVNFTNWYSKTSVNKTDNHDFVAMYIDGLWKTFDGNYSSGVIICQKSCLPRK